MEGKEDDLTRSMKRVKYTLKDYFMKYYRDVCVCVLVCRVQTVASLTTLRGIFFNLNYHLYLLRMMQIVLNLVLCCVLAM